MLGMEKMLQSMLGMSADDMRNAKDSAMSFFQSVKEIQVSLQRMDERISVLECIVSDLSVHTGFVDKDERDTERLQLLLLDGER